MGPFELLEKIIKIFEVLNIPYLVTGSIASMAYGEPRLTNDIDIVAKIEEKDIKSFVNYFPEDEYYLTDAMMQKAIAYNSQFNIIHPASGLKIDIMIKSNTPFDNSRFNRIKRIYPSEYYQANFASPEDVIIKKMEYYKEGASEKHLRDITGIIKISNDQIDYKYIEDWAECLGLIEIWRAVKNRLE